MTDLGSIGMRVVEGLTENVTMGYDPAGVCGTKDGLLYTTSTRTVAGSVPSYFDDVNSVLKNSNYVTTTSGIITFKTSKDLGKKIFEATHPDYPKKIIRSGPVTVVFWNDGTKTLVRRAGDTEDDIYSAFTAALAKKIFKSNSAVKRVIKKTLRPEKEKNK